MSESVGLNHVVLAIGLSATEENRPGNLYGYIQLLSETDGSIATENVEGANEVDGIEEDGELAAMGLFTIFSHFLSDLPV